jgi:hypothetical protein
VFVCRLRQMEIAQDLFYQIKMTREQRRWCDEALAYSRLEKKYSKEDIMYGLASAFWSPTNSDIFRGMAKDPFSDATVRFACLMNLLPKGDFQNPRTACHNLVRIKYFIRSALFMNAIKQHERKKLPMDG